MPSKNIRGLADIDIVDAVKEEEVAHLNFKVSPEFKKEFKLFALQHDLSMKQVLEKAFLEYKENNK
jgi:hypothetical protein